MSSPRHDDLPAADQEAAATELHDALGALLDSTPAPAPELSDEELLAEILRAAQYDDDSDSGGSTESDESAGAESRGSAGARTESRE
ncbi:MAG TPA: hypothetical protein VFH94_16685 [Streptomyces sp.]|nr:hypothetical protein [Streptomyces sp.]